MEEKTFRNLPIELQLMVVSYVRPFDLLQCRLVSRAWNSFLTSSAKVQERVTFLLSSGNESWTVFKKSEVLWSSLNLRISDAGLGTCLDFGGSPTQQVISVMLEINERVDVWACVIQILEQFGGLRRLVIRELPFPSDEHLELGHEPGSPEFLKVVRQLEGLTLIVHSSVRLRAYLRNFIAANGLKVLQVKSFLSASADAEPPTTPPAELSSLITGSVKTLKVLRLDLSTTATTETWDSILRYLVPHSPALDLTMLHSRDQVSVHSNELEVHEAFLNSHIMFFRSQLGLKDVSLSWLLYGTQDQLRSLLGSIPVNVERLELWGRQIVPEFFNRFPDLKKLYIQMENESDELCLDRIPFLEALDSTDEYAGLESLTLLEPTHAVLMSSLCVFPRLSTLIIQRVDPELASAVKVTDIILQEIIRTLPDLRSLKIESDLELTEFGITGVPPVEMTRLRKKYISWEALDSKEVRRTGLPLHSLARLEELVFEDAGSVITNAGIELGFQFKGLRKLSLAMTDVTDSGLKRLGELNPALIKILIGQSATTLGGQAAFRLAFKCVPDRSLILN